MTTMTVNLHIYGSTPIAAESATSGDCHWLKIGGATLFVRSAEDIARLREALGDLAGRQFSPDKPERVTCGRCGFASALGFVRSTPVCASCVMPDDHDLIVSGDRSTVDAGLGGPVGARS